MSEPEGKSACAMGYQCDIAKGIEGMTLRDWFAGMAMQAMLTDGFQPNSLRANHSNTADFNYFRAAYAAADAMLREREAK